MDVEFRTCQSEMEFEAYIKFLLQYHQELNLPYSFAMNLSFVSSPLIFGKAMLIRSDEPYEIVGAAGFVYGTGANDYEDQHVCQVEVAFLQKQFRNTFLFLYSLDALLKEMKNGNPDVKQIQFWTAMDDEKLGRLFTKFSAVPGSTKSVVNNLVLYTVLFDELEAYCHQFSRILKRHEAHVF
ncbi:hypothetical protein F9U64_14300 [Gracilibacillus oryzae]|uniref:Uncharacterized protein n=1 Tax=Gracilibacillus oryzae TaxID=1672701 RepID=A0A7C8KRF9_9BACI|nr:hypothetical protein [Gracilibacillus oryzae]KAB8130512.1 hypothetical protein F9U64_14300 [Gracilibacillus oryzae]